MGRVSVSPIGMAAIIIINIIIMTGHHPVNAEGGAAEGPGHRRTMPLGPRLKAEEDDEGMIGNASEGGRV